jgi:hypothetical protein
MKIWSWKLNNIYVHPLIISAEGVVTINFLKYLDNTDVTKNILKVGQKEALLQTCHIQRKFLGHDS